jgi:nicotinamidase-related amidase
MRAAGFAATCLKATGRCAMELGYHATLVTDAPAAFSADRTHAAHALNGPEDVHAILTMAELLAMLPNDLARRLRTEHSNKETPR